MMNQNTALTFKQTQREITLETGGEDVKTTLETGGEDVKTTLETSVNLVFNVFALIFLVICIIFTHTKNNFKVKKNKIFKFLETQSF